MNELGKIFSAFDKIFKKAKIYSPKLPVSENGMREKRIKLLDSNLLKLQDKHSALGSISYDERTTQRCRPSAHRI